MSFTSIGETVQVNLWVCKQDKTLELSQLWAHYNLGVLLCFPEKNMEFFVFIIILESLNFSDADKMPLKPFLRSWIQDSKMKKRKENGDVKA